MREPHSNTIIFTDLDGTLLDHDSYCFDAAVPQLRKLEELGVPVIPVSSKTDAEIGQLRSALGLKTPYIVENGAAVFMPEAWLERASAVSASDLSATEVVQHDLAHRSGCYLKEFSRSRADWRRILAKELSEFSHCFQSFTELGVQGIVQSTGLSLEHARQANQRDYSEPLLWQGTPEQKHLFSEAVSALGFTLLEGGRFLHLTDGYDKGLALRWLLDFYQTYIFGNACHSAALGDSQNDVAMLEVAEKALLVRSPVHDWPQLQRTASVYQSHSCGPQGWSELITQHVIPYLKQG